MASDGSGMKRQFDGGADDFDPSKRKRNSQPTSRVVFVCGLPADCLESELLALCCPFAVVEKSLMVPQKRQAFVQLPDVTSAANLVTFYQTRDALIRGKKIFFDFSNRNEIITHQESEASASYHHEQQPQQHQQVGPHGLPRAAPFQQPLSTQFGPSQDQPPFGQRGMIAHGGPRRGIGPPNQILMVSVSKIEYDITVDVLQQVFQKFGNVQKIVTFWKNNEFKSLVQMESVDQAQAAQSALDGRDIYTGCNQLSIVFSRHPDLNVRYNDDRSRDYTNPNLPPGPGRGGDARAENESLTTAPVDGRDAPRDNGYNNSFPRHDEYAFRGPAHAPNIGRGDQYAPDMRDGRGPPFRHDDRHPSVDGPRDDRGGRELPAHSTGRAVRGDTRPSPALICSNIDPELVNPHHLFTLFGCFGDVLRIKVMFRKRDTALIQFVDEVHSTSALDHLDGVYVFGKKLRVDYSKHASVSMPHADADRFELENTLDFSGSPHHRYRRRSPQEAVSPCPLLHMSGIPMELQNNRNAVVDLFAQYGFVKNFHYLQNNPRMALVEMGSVDEAIMALLHVDNMTYPDSHMRISFSRAYQFSAGNGDSGPASRLGPMSASGAAPGGWNPSMQSRPRNRSRDRSRNRERGPPVGGNRDRSPRDRGPPPPQRGREFQQRDNSRRPPPRY
uniref:RRM domain-containing protein n=1 Tax=Peronospora matthiolae TaxID=2874970 RepID=A0AAV1UM75_9STRA